MKRPDDALHVLALNSGSSSLKFGVYEVSASRTETLLSGSAEAIGDKQGRFHAEDAQGRVLASEAAAIPGHGEAIERIGRLLDAARLLDGTKLPAPVVIGHRIVHGGPELRKHCVIDGAVLRQLEAAAVFAPLHTPPALSVIRFAQAHFPGLAQVACFDTSFHAGLPDVARVLPVSRALRAQGIERYGFHGLSCESILHHLGDDPPERLIIAHLGNGASITAVRSGRSVDTSMGLTPTGGVIMGTRCGDLDPGVLIYLIREKQFDAAMLEDLVDHHSGMSGISGLGSDMRRLREAAPSNEDARLAIEMFCYSVRKQIAAMIAALDGVDRIVFTGGIGEHDWQARAAICDGLSWIGVELDAARNQERHNPISAVASRCVVEVLGSEEDAQIARHAWALCPSRQA